MAYQSRFDYLTDAFDEMEFLAKTTGRTYQVYKRKKNGYRVVEKGCQGVTGKLIAELNCRNLIGESDINAKRGLKIQRVVSLDKKRLMV